MFKMYAIVLVTMCNNSIFELIQIKLEAHILNNTVLNMKDTTRLHDFTSRRVDISPILFDF